jgi:hypothetical protein
LTPITSALPKLNVGSAITAEIQHAVSAGKQVTVHEAKVDISGWQGAGYIIADPETGAAAYKIGSGENGGFLPWLSGAALGASSAAILFLAGALATAWPFVTGLWLGIAIVATISAAIYNLKIWANTGCFWQGIGTGSAAVGMILAATGISEMIAAVGTLPGAQNVASMISNAISGFVGMLVGTAIGQAIPTNTTLQCLE